MKDLNCGIGLIYVDRTASMSLSEVIVRHRIKKQEEEKEGDKGYCFVVNQPNKYEPEADSQKIVQVHILDIIFDNKICNLTYMHDITQIVKNEGKDSDKMFNLVGSQYSITDATSGSDN